VLKGAKEGKWNYKYMKLVEKPVNSIEQATTLKAMVIVVGPLLSCLKNIYENSQFYKEARIVSFIDRLLACITNKLRGHCSIGKSVAEGRKDYQSYSTQCL
jgi:hypothetical protein